MNPRDLIIHSLNNPSSVATIDELDWDLLIRQARRASLLAKLACVLADKGLLGQVPEKPRLHLESARKMAEQQAVSSRWEVDCICEALASLETPIVLLKGAAYLKAELPLSDGRSFSDIDILVPELDLAAAETALLIKGWVAGPISDYDQRYYRRWMHELPPMHHRRRGTTVDVHHTLLPRTARVKIDGSRLFDGLMPLPNHPGLWVLPPATMVLHSATHLFHEGEFGNGLRDLFDLDAMLRHFGTDPGFWLTLVETARAMGVGRPLFYALAMTQRILGAPVPAPTIIAARTMGPPAPLAGLMGWLFRQALVPVHPTCTSPSRRLAWLVLYVRSHWLRMPTVLLLAHLGRKAWRRISGQEAREAEQRQRAEDPA